MSCRSRAGQRCHCQRIAKRVNISIRVKTQLTVNSAARAVLSAIADAIATDRLANAAVHLTGNAGLGGLAHAIAADRRARAAVSRAGYAGLSAVADEIATGRSRAVFIYHPVAVVINAVTHLDGTVIYCRISVIAVNGATEAVCVTIRARGCRNDHGFLNRSAAENGAG